MASTPEAGRAWVLGHRRAADFSAILEQSLRDIWFSCAVAPRIGDQLLLEANDSEVFVTRSTKRCGKVTQRFSSYKPLASRDPFTGTGCTVEPIGGCWSNPPEQEEEAGPGEGGRAVCLQLSSSFPGGGRKVERFQQLPEAPLVLRHDIWLTPSAAGADSDEEPFQVDAPADSENDPKVASELNAFGEEASPPLGIEPRKPAAAAAAAVVVHVQHFYWLKHAGALASAASPSPCACPEHLRQTDPSEELGDVWLPDEEIRKSSPAVPSAGPSAAPSKHGPPEERLGMRRAASTSSLQSGAHAQKLHPQQQPQQQQQQQQLKQRHQLPIPETIDVSHSLNGSGGHSPPKQHHQQHHQQHQQHQQPLPSNQPQKERFLSFWNRSSSKGRARGNSAAVLDSRASLSEQQQPQRQHQQQQPEPPPQRLHRSHSLRDGGEAIAPAPSSPTSSQPPAELRAREGALPLQLTPTQPEESVLGRRVLWSLRQQSEFEMAARRILPELGHQADDPWFLTELKVSVSRLFLRTHAWLQTLSAEVHALYTWVYQVSQMEAKLRNAPSRLRLPTEFSELHNQVQVSLEMEIQLNDKRALLGSRLHAWDKERVVLQWLARGYNLEYGLLQVWKEVRRRCSLGSASAPASASALQPQPQPQPLLHPAALLQKRACGAADSGPALELTLLSLAHAAGSAELLARVEQLRRDLFRHRNDALILGFYYLSGAHSGAEGWHYSEIREAMPSTLFQRAKLGSQRREALTAEQLQRCVDDMMGNLRRWFGELRVLLRLELVAAHRAEGKGQGHDLGPQRAQKTPSSSSQDVGPEPELAQASSRTGGGRANILAVIRRLGAERRRLVELTRLLRGRMRAAVLPEHQDPEDPRKALQLLYR